MLNEKFENDENKGLREHSPIEVESLTVKQFKEKLFNMNVSKNLKLKLPVILKNFVEIFKSGAEIKYNIVVVTDKSERRIAEMITSYLSYKGVCHNNLLTTYNYTDSIVGDDKKFMSLFEIRPRFREEYFNDIKEAHKNISTIMVIKRSFFDEYIEYFSLLFPFCVVDEYTEKEKIDLMSKKIDALGFTCNEKNFIKRGVEISGGLQTFDLELNGYLVSKSILSRDRIAYVKEFEAHVLYRDWEKVQQLEEKKNEEDKSANININLSFEELVGQKAIKKDLHRIVNYINKNKNENSTFHMAFLGNPGTGKTTVARLLSKELYKNGVIKKDNFVEVSRGNLVAEFVGQTAIKTQKVIESALGGVLFIDEAYSLATSKSDRDFGPEAIATLVKEMEDKKDILIVIFAGYSKKTKDMIKTNPGLASRIPFQIEFEDYSVDELMEIFEIFVSKSKYKIDNEVGEIAKEFFQKEKDKGVEDFANARLVRNFFERLKLVQTERSEGYDLTKEDAIIAAEELTKNESKKIMGFVG